MGAAAGWIGAIVGAVIATALIDLLMAEGETKKYVKGIASLLVLAVIIAPLPSLIDGDFSLTGGETVKSPITETNNDYLERVYMERYKGYELSIQNKLKAAGIDEVTVRIAISYDGGEIVIDSVNVDTSNLVLKDGSKNIDINVTVKNAVIAVLGRRAESKIVIK